MAGFIFGGAQSRPTTVTVYDIYYISAMVLKRQNKIENMDISEKHDKVNSLIHENFNKFKIDIIITIRRHCFFKNA